MVFGIERLRYLVFVKFIFGGGRKIPHRSRPVQGCICQTRRSCRKDLSREPEISRMTS